jgi:CubicO group peptidase (beta-lactamase class C family)
MIGSITKELTQVLGYVLEERGVLSRDDTLAKWLPDFDGPIGAVTIGQVIEHEAGLPDLIDADGEPVPYTIEYDYTPVSRDELLQRARLADLIDEPGTRTEYSNLGYQLLAAVYELATEKSFPELLHQYIYVPAGMPKTAFWFDDEPAELLVDGCLPGGARWGNPVEDRMWDESGPSWNLMGAGGLLSTAASLAAFLEGVGQDAYFETRDQAERYRAGRLVFSKNRQQLMMGPAGSNGIFNAVAVWLDGDRVSIVLLTNRADHPGEGGLVQEIARRVR